VLLLCSYFYFSKGAVGVGALDAFGAAGGVAVVDDDGAFACDVTVGKLEVAAAPITVAVTLWFTCLIMTFP